jgi:hypothetical protein
VCVEELKKKTIFSLILLKFSRFVTCMKNREKITNNGIITEVELGVEPMTMENTGSVTYHDTSWVN